MTYRNQLARRLREWAGNRDRYVGFRDDGVNLLYEAASMLETPHVSPRTLDVAALRRAVVEANECSSTTHSIPTDDADVIRHAVGVARRYTYCRKLVAQIGTRLGIGHALKAKG